VRDGLYRDLEKGLASFIIKDTSDWSDYPIYVFPRQILYDYLNTGGTIRVYYLHTISISILLGNI